MGEDELTEKSMTTKAQLLALVEQYGSKVGAHAAVEATRVATDRKDRGPRPSELRMRDEARELKTTIQAAIGALPIECENAQQYPRRSRRGSGIEKGRYGAGPTT